MSISAQAASFSMTILTVQLVLQVAASAIEKWSYIIKGKNNLNSFHQTVTVRGPTCLLCRTPYTPTCLGKIVRVIGNSKNRIKMLGRYLVHGVGLKFSALAYVGNTLRLNISHKKDILFNLFIKYTQ
jgi:hypothetical protein